MASRNLVYRALALRARESPRGDRILCLMTAEEGLQDVFVFGGPKSKLRSLAAPYSAGRAFVYRDPVKEYCKLGDFEVLEPFSGLRECLRKIWAAGLVAEFLQKTSGGGGEFPLVLDLSLDALRGLEALPEEKADYPILLYLWRMLGLLGLGPDTASCASCGADLEPRTAQTYSPQASGFLCPACARAESSRELGWHESGDLGISAGARRWLDRAAELPFSEALRAGLDASSLDGLKSMMFHLAKKAAEGPLATLQSGVGIL